jgi:hypothetical protein
MALEELVKEARHAFILAKSDGVLDAGEVVQIGLLVARGVQKLQGLSGPEKKAVVLLSLKKGLDAAGGLPGFDGADAAVKEEVEKNLLAAASAAVDAALAVAAGKLDLRKPAAWKACCLPLLSAGAAAAQAYVPKDQPLLKEALSFVAKKTSAAIQESEVKVESVKVTSEPEPLPQPPKVEEPTLNTPDEKAQ